MIGKPKFSELTFTPQTAQQWIDDYRYQYQRDIRQSRVKRIIKAMDDGEFTGNTIKIAEMGKSKYLYNGQHTLLALVQSERTMDLPVEYRAVDTLDDVATLYSTTDTNKVRDFGDKCKAMRFDEKLDLGAKPMKQFGRTIQFMAAQFSRQEAQYVGMGEVESLMYEYIPFYRKFTDISDHSVLTSRTMTKVPVMSVALVTFKYAPEKAESFWIGVSNNDGLTEGDPRRTLHYFLLKAIVGGGGRSGYHWEQIMRIVAKCWNAYCENKQLHRIVTTATSSRVTLNEIGIDV